jgi:ABC-type glycerol-3-phosphate transport system permease component
VQPVPLPYVWLFLVGLTWGFHLCFTVQSLLTRQPDILEYGRILSYAVIYIFNMLGILLWLICTTSISLSAVVAALLVRTVAAYSAVGNLLARAVAGAIRKLSGA